MKTNALIFLLCLVSIVSKAQNFGGKSLVFIGIDKSVDRHNALQPLPVYRYGISYDRFITPKFSLDGYLSYLSHYKREQVIPFDYYFLSDRSQRLTLDLSALYSILNSRRHIIRIGGGPTLWYQKNTFARNLTTYLTVGGQGVDYVTFDKVSKDEYSLGLNLTITYDYSITDHFLIGLRGGVSGSVISKTTESGTVNSLNTAGIRVGYSF